MRDRSKGAVGAHISPTGRLVRRLGALASVAWLAGGASLSAETIVQGTLPGGEWAAAGSPYRATADVDLPAGTTLTVRPGVEVLFDPGVSFVIAGRLAVEGTAEARVRFVRADPVERWAGVAFRGSAAVGALDHLELEGAQAVRGETRIAFKVDDRARVTLRNCWFHDFPEVAIDATNDSELVVQDSIVEHSMEAIHTADTYTLIERTTVRHVRGYADSIDLDWETTPRSVIRDCIIEDNSDDDGIDLQGSSALVENVIIRGVTGGKAISIDFPCTPTIRNVLVHDSMWGFVVKDSSTPQFERCTVTRCEKGFYVFEKNAGAGGGHMTAHSMIAWGNQTNIEVDAKSTLALTYSLAGGGYAGQGNIDADPLFVDPAADDFHLRPGSPAIGTGKDGSDMGVYSVGPPPIGTEVGGTIEDASWTEARSPYHATSDLLLPAGRTLAIEAGVELRLDPGVSLEVRGALSALGTEAKPIRFVRADSGSRWGGVAFRGSGAAGTLDHLEIAGPSAAPGATGIGVEVDAGARVTLRDCWLHDFPGIAIEAADGSELVVHDTVIEDAMGGIQAISSRILVERTTIRRVPGTADSIHIEGESTPPSEVRDCVIEDNSGDDGIDLEASSVLIEDVVLRRIAGNAISIDLPSTPVIRGVVVHDAVRGLAIKDSATPRIERCTVTRCERGFHLYEKTGGAGGGHATADSMILWGNETDVEVDARSSLELTFSLVGGGYAGEGNLDADPRFADPDSDDFRLLDGSPAIGTGKDGGDMGALPPIGSQAAAFLRGDGNRDGTADISDAVFILLYLFLEPVDAPCLDALDVDDARAIEISDSIHLLRFLFLNGPSPPAPFPGAGPDPTADDPLDCAAEG